MKTAVMLVMTLGLAAVLGCESKSDTGGGAARDEGFTISVPSGPTQIKQGETLSVRLSLKRGANFKRDVKLELKAAQGISVDPTSVTIKAADAPEVQVRVTAPRDVALGDYKVSVTGIPETGQRADLDFAVKVVAP